MATLKNKRSLSLLSGLVMSAKSEGVVMKRACRVFWKASQIRELCGG